MSQCTNMCVGGFGKTSVFNENNPLTLYSIHYESLWYILNKKIIYNEFEFHKIIFYPVKIKTDKIKLEHFGNVFLELIFSYFCWTRHAISCNTWL